MNNQNWLIEHKILKLKLSILEITNQLSEALKLQKYELANEIREQKNQIENQLSDINLELIHKQKELCFSSENIEELRKINCLLKYFENPNLLFSENIDNEIDRLFDLKAQYNKVNDFKSANYCRDEINKLSEYRKTLN